MRNVWAHSIIFCGHFPDQTYTFSEEEVAEETRGGWYVRQLLGAANIDGSPLFHLLSGNLSFQVEHHLFPDMPSSRYAEIAPRVRDVCQPLRPALQHRAAAPQLGSVHRTILRLAFPGGRPRRKPRRLPARSGLNAAAQRSSRRHGFGKDGTIYGMVKTTVYLDDRDAAALRRIAAESGRSQAEIIREAIGRTTRSVSPRRLRSAGVGRGSGASVARNADRIVREELGRSPR